MDRIEFEICVFSRFNGRRVIPHIVHNDLDLARQTAENAVAREHRDYRNADEVTIEVWSPKGTKVVDRGRVVGRKLYW
jgi:hypothetical protein